MKNICIICEEEFIRKSNTSGLYCSISCSNIDRYRKNKERYKENPKLCPCGDPIPYDKRHHNTYCSKPCFAKFENRRRKEEGWSHPAKKYNTRKEANAAHNQQTRARRIGAEGPYCPVSFSICDVTGKAYRSDIPESKGRIRRSPYVKLDEKKQYYEDARFTFWVYNFPEEFELSLVEKHRWYSTPGSRNGIKNVEGVSRDHMFSISEGFRLGIDPKILAHPANCQLMRHRDNKRKHGECSILLEKLYKKIEEWEKKYSKII